MTQKRVFMIRISIRNLVALPWTLFAIGAIGCVGDPLPQSHSPRDPANPEAPEVAMPPATPARPMPDSMGSARASEMTASDPGVIYTCPMHPEVQESAPGRCPKCGMTLVPKKP